MLNKTNLIRICNLFIATILVSGCVAIQPFPNIARSGDTVLIAVGSPDGMTKANTTALYVPDDGSSSIDLTSSIRSIFKLYPDQTSEVWLANGLVNNVITDAHHSPWLTIVAVDLIGVNVGTGLIQFNTDAEISSLATSINASTFPVEVIAGAGEPNLFQYDIFSGTTRTGDLSLLEPLLQISVTPPLGADGTTYGAIEYKLNVPLINNDGSVADDTAMTVVVDNMARPHQLSQLQTMWSRDNDVVTVIITSPVATMEAWHAKYSIVVFEDPKVLLGITGSTLDNTKPIPSLLSIKYFDANGNESIGPIPTVDVLSPELG